MSGTDDKEAARQGPAATPSCRAGAPCSCSARRRRRPWSRSGPRSPRPRARCSIARFRCPGPMPAAIIIAADGSLVAPGTPGAAPPLARPLRGEEVQAAAARRHHARRRRSAIRSGLCQLHPAPAGGDERFHLLRLAADAALSWGRRHGRPRLHRRSRRRGPQRRARRPVGAVPRALGHDPYRRGAGAGDPRRAARGPGRRRPNCCAGCARGSSSKATRPKRRSTPASTSSRPPAWCAAHEAPARHPDRPGRLPHRLGLAGAARRARPPLRRLSRARRTGFATSPSGSSPKSPGGAASAPRSRSAAIISCPTPRRCRSPTACSPPRWA